METQGRLTYQKNFGYYWITGLSKIFFVLLCALFGGAILALFPVMFAAVMLIAPLRSTADSATSAQDAGITIFGCLVTNLSLIALFMGFVAGDWIWALCFFGLYGGVCAVAAGLIGIMVLTYESSADKSERLESEYDSGFA
ncbi:MAG: hypothetical protein KBC16_00235 [Candidatus Pacebacteria bacterium]|nr:hypothetical protein [Candidatus Paceibacterota bacterium]